jgi:AraC family transcriptional activator of pyochelin receptor
MTISFTAHGFAQQWQESKQSGDIVCHGDGVEAVESCPPWLGRGERRTLHLGGALDLEIRNECYPSDWSVQNHHEDRFGLTAKFYLSGCSAVQTRGIADEYVEQAGQHYLYCLPDTEEIEGYSSDEQLHFVMLWLEPSRLRSLGMEHLTSLAPELQQFLEQDTRPFFHQSLGRTTPEMQQVLQRLLHCPYRGFVRHLYLESQALMLLSLQLAQWLEPEPITPKKVLLCSDDVERIHHARAILAQNLVHPPSVMELARRVGVNDFKLKQGFQQVFKTTPFGYLREQRLRLAQQLLNDTEMRVEEVAIAVGYQSRSSFTAAFRRQFGITPKARRRQKSRGTV